MKSKLLSYPILSKNESMQHTAEADTVKEHFIIKKRDIEGLSTTPS